MTLSSYCARSGAAALFDGLRQEMWAGRQFRRRPKISGHGLEHFTGPGVRPPSLSTVQTKCGLMPQSQRTARLAQRQPRRRSLPSGRTRSAACLF
jgi:hypothetical protein